MPDGPAKAKRLVAQRTARSEAKRLAVLVRPVSAQCDMYYTSLIETVITEAHKRNVRAEIVQWPQLSRLFSKNRFPTFNYAATLVLGFWPEDAFSLYLLHKRQLPILTYNQKLSQLDIPSVLIDEYGAANQIADMFHAMGHRNMCLVTDERGGDRHHAPQAMPLVTGWIDYLRRNDLLEECVLPVYRLECEAGLPRYSRGFEKIVRSNEGPTAFLFSHAQWAYDFLSELRFGELEIPEYCSIAAMDTGHYPPTAGRGLRLTSASVDLRRVAECIIETILKLISGDLHPPSIRVPLVLERTESIGPPLNRRGT